MNMDAPVILYLALSLQLCGFSRANLFLVQETQPAQDIDLTCFKTFPIKAATCLQVGAMSLDWPVDPCARFDHSRSSLSLSLEVPSDDQRRDTLPASRRSRWKQNTLQAPPQVLQRITGHATIQELTSQIQQLQERVNA